MTTHQSMEEINSIPTFTFKLLGHTKADDGLVKHYHLEITDLQSERTMTISVEPKHLASARSMKRILLERCMFYRATRAQHDMMLLDILDPNPDEIQEQPGLQGY